MVAAVRLLTAVLTCGGHYIILIASSEATVLPSQLTFFPGTIDLIQSHRFKLHIYHNGKRDISFVYVCSISFCFT